MREQIRRVVVDGECAAERDFPGRGREFDRDFGDRDRDFGNRGGEYGGYGRASGPEWRGRFDAQRSGSGRYFGEAYGRDDYDDYGESGWHRAGSPSAETYREGYRGRSFGGRGYSGGAERAAVYGAEYGGPADPVLRAREREENWRRRWGRGREQSSGGYQSGVVGGESRGGWSDRGWYGERRPGSAYGRPIGRFSGRGPRDYQRSDDRIREEICDLLTADPDLDATNIIVVVQSGEVTLSGTVEDRRDKRAAEDTAEEIPGVKQVHNRLRIEPAESNDAVLGGRGGREGTTDVRPTERSTQQSGINEQIPPTSATSTGGATKTTKS